MLQNFKKTQIRESKLENMFLVKKIFLIINTLKEKKLKIENKFFRLFYILYLKNILVYKLEI